MKINKVIKVLVSTDSILEFAYGLVTPVFAIFIVESIQGGTAQVAGTAVAIYWLVKSVVRVPLALFLDKWEGETDDFYSMISGFFLYSVCLFLFNFASTPMHVYEIQFLTGIAGALAFTPWYGFFTRHIDKKREDFEWSVSVSVAGFGIALAGFLAGVIAEHLGFNYIFTIGGTLSLLATILLFFIGKNLKKRTSDGYNVEFKESV